jgi:hypothetical protein
LQDLEILNILKQFHQNLKFLLTQDINNIMTQCNTIKRTNTSQTKALEPHSFFSFAISRHFSCIRISSSSSQQETFRSISIKKKKSKQHSTTFPDNDASSTFSRNVVYFQTPFTVFAQNVRLVFAADWKFSEINQESSSK